MPAALSFIDNDSFQTAQHDSQAFSMNPYRLQITGQNSPVFSPNVETFSDRYLKQANLSKDMQEDKNERGEYLDTRIWKLLDINRKTDARGRIHVNETNYEKDIRVFVSAIDQELETCKNYVLLPDSIYTEVLKSRAKDQIGEPLKVQKNGDVWTGSINKNKFVKIFVKEG